MHQESVLPDAPPSGLLPKRRSSEAYLNDEGTNRCQDGGLIAAFGARPVAFIVLLEFSSRGILAGGLMAMLLPMYREWLGVRDSAEFQRYRTVVLLAWSIAKPLMGLVSDSFPINGYAKRWYIVLALCIVSGIMALLASVHFTAVVFTGLAFIAMSCLVCVDILVQGTYSAMIRDKGAAGPSLLALSYGSATVGGIIAALAIGHFADTRRLDSMLWAMVPVALMATLPPCLNWANEAKVGEGLALQTESASLLKNVSGNDVSPASKGYGGVANHESPAARSSALHLNDKADDLRWLTRNLRGPVALHPQLAALTMIIAGFGLTLAIVMMTSPVLVSLVACIGAVVTVVALGFRWLSRMHARAMTAVAVWGCTSLSIGGALSYFYLADDNCVKGGPHFDYSYYTSITTLVSAVAILAGLGLFHAVLSRKTYASVIILTTIAGGVSCVFDLLIVTRTNQAVLGLSDKATFLLGDAMIRPAIEMMAFMPSVLLTSRLCHPGVESVMYAVLAGFSNLSSSVSNVFGQFMMQMFGIRSTVPCDFSNLALLIVVTNVILPFAFLPVVCHLLPNARMHEELITKAEDGKPEAADSAITA